MEDRLLKFAQIVDAGTFTRAAQLMHISQPALTAAVKKLEKELGVELLIRGGSRLLLTDAGQIAYETAQRVAVQTQNMATQLAQAKQEKVLLHLGMIDSLATLLFIKKGHLTDLEAHARISLTVDNSTRLVELTRRGRLDVALVARPDNLPSTISSQILGEEPLVFVAHPSIAAAIRRQMSEGKLSQVMSYNRTSQTNRIITGHFEAAGITFEPAFYSTSPEIMLQLALGGRGAVVLPYLLVQTYLKQGKVTIIPVKGSALIHRNIVSISSVGRHLPAAASQLILQVKKELRQLSQETNNV